MAALNMGMSRCQKRYHRQLYVGWEVPALVRNVSVLYMALYPEMAELRADKRFFGLDRYLQYQSAVQLYAHGLEVSKAALGSPRTRRDEHLHPAGVPHRRRRLDAPPTPLPPRDPTTHTLVNVYQRPKGLPKPGLYVNNRPTEWWTSGGRCCACQALAERLGYMEVTYEGERGRMTTSARHMPTADRMPEHWQHVKPDALVPRRRTACLECSKKCKRAVWLCEGCHESELIWDHGLAQPMSHRVEVG